MPVPFINIYPRKLCLQKNTNSISADLHARGRSVWHAAEYWIKSKKINTASVLPLIQLALICLYSLCICVPTAFPSVLIYAMKFLGNGHKCDGHSVNYHNKQIFYYIQISSTKTLWTDWCFRNSTDEHWQTQAITTDCQILTLNVSDSLFTLNTPDPGNKKQCVGQGQLENKIGRGPWGLSLGTTAVRQCQCENGAMGSFIAPVEHISLCSVLYGKVYNDQGERLEYNFLNYTKQNVS